MCAKSIHHRRAIFRNNLVVSPKQRYAEIVGQLAPDVIDFAGALVGVHREKIHDHNLVLSRFDEHIRHILRQIVELWLLGPKAANRRPARKSKSPKFE
jgi:hypothetical protein